MAYAPCHIIGDYYMRTDIDAISRGFQLVNPVKFDIKSYVLQGLIDNPFNGQAIRDTWEHITMFYQTCSMCKPTRDITGEQVKLHLFEFSLISRAKDWLQCIPNGMIQTWKELEDKFLEIYYSNAQFNKIKVKITNFIQDYSESLLDA